MTVDQAIANLQRLKRNLKTLVGNEMVNYALDNIKRQRDIRGVPLKKRKPGSKRDSGRAILVDTGKGRRSIQARSTPKGVELVAEDYMVAHNEGAAMRGTRRVRAHVRKRKGRSEEVKAHSRTVNYELPERQYTGDSNEQRGRINQMVSNQIVKALT